MSEIENDDEVGDGGKTILSDDYLTQFRDSIDKIDGYIVKLLKERAKIVHSVRALKRSVTKPNNILFIKPGREYDVLSDRLKAVEPSDYSHLAFFNLWRQMITASNILEQSFLKVGTIVALNDVHQLHIFYGGMLPVVQYSSAQRMFLDLISCEDNNGGINIAAFYKSDIDALKILAHPSLNDVRIFAELPAIIHPDSAHLSQTPILLAARVSPFEHQKFNTILMVKEKSTRPRIYLHNIVDFLSECGYRADLCASTHDTIEDSVTYKVFMLHGFVASAEAINRKAATRFKGRKIFFKILGAVNPKIII